MQFALICHDRPGALAERLAVRNLHLSGVVDLKREGRIIEGGAILDAEGNMTGSVVLCDFPDRAALDAYLKSEVYVRNKVWETVEVLSVRLVQWEAIEC